MYFSIGCVMISVSFLRYTLRDGNDVEYLGCSVGVFF